MAHRTHPTQQDEALRQARTSPSTRELRTRAGLQWIAKHLATTQPHTAMTSDTAKQAARLYAIQHADSSLANALMWDLRRALPDVLHTDTRDTYAARIHLALQQVTA